MGRGERHTWSEVCREWEQISREKVLVAPATACSSAPRDPPPAHHPIHVRRPGFPYDPSQRLHGNVTPPPPQHQNRLRAHTPTEAPLPLLHLLTPGSRGGCSDPPRHPASSIPQHSPGMGARGGGGGGRAEGPRPLRGGSPGEKQLLPGRALGAPHWGTAVERGEKPGMSRAWGRRNRGHTPAPGRRKGPGDAAGFGEGGKQG